MKTIICKKCGAAIDPSLGECPNCGAVYYVLPNDDPPERGQEPYAAPRQEGYGAETPPYRPEGYSAETPPYRPEGYSAETPPYRPEGYGTETPPYRPEGYGAPQQGAYGQNAYRPEDYQSPGYRQGGYGPQDYRQGGYQDRGVPREKLDSELMGAQKDDLFETGVWHTYRDEEQDQTRAYAPPPRREAPPPQGQRRSAPPPRQGVQSRSGRYEDYEEPEPVDDGKSQRKKSFIIAGLGLIAVLTVIIAIVSGAFNFGKNEKEKMPLVVGMNVDIATEHLENLGLKVDTQREDSDRPKDEVIEQSIKEGKVIKEGNKVMLTVSSGSEEDDEDEEDQEIPAPYLLGMTYDRARREAEDKDLKLTKGADEYSNEPVGNIIRQSPAEGTQLRKGDLITVTLSKGPEPSPSPTGWKITVTVGSGGTVSPKGVVTVPDGQDKAFTINPDSGYEIGDVKVDGVSVGQVTSYTFTRVTSDHSIYVIFRLKPQTPSPSPSTPPPESPDIPPIEPIEPVE